MFSPTNDTPLSVAMKTVKTGVPIKAKKNIQDVILCAIPIDATEDDETPHYIRFGAEDWTGTFVELFKMKFENDGNGVPKNLENTFTGASSFYGQGVFQGDIFVIPGPNGTSGAISCVGNLTAQKRLLQASVSIPSQYVLQLGSANHNMVTGSTSIEGMSKRDIPPGTHISLEFSGTPTLKNNGTPSTGVGTVEITATITPGEYDATFTNSQGLIPGDSFVSNGQGYLVLSGASTSFVVAGITTQPAGSSFTIDSVAPFKLDPASDLVVTAGGLATFILNHSGTAFILESYRDYI